MDESETERLISTDVSNLSGEEMLDHLDSVERRMKDLLKAELDLLEASAELLADRPQLQARLDYLRTVDLKGATEAGD
ncbi:hypothetical protein ACGFIF_11380 [Kribbella sp. NPDC049174]|uniref:hypothetical protein n=1 Tax=Kribbella sp. NPDC049174 TaxID=3364112 RepID=UPI00370FDF53